VARFLVWFSPPLNRVVSQVFRMDGGGGLDFWVLHECLLYVYVAAAVGLLLFSRREI